METILLTDPEVISRIYELHMKKDFPVNELKPFAVIRKAWERGGYDCYGMFDGGELAGYAYFLKIPAGEPARLPEEQANALAGEQAKLPEEQANALAGERFYYLLDYFAVVDGSRGQGCGSLLLQQLSEIIRNAECIVIEVEDPDKAANEPERELRERRLQFYLRNGSWETGAKSRTFGVDYRLLQMSGERHSAEEVRKIYESLYKSALPAVMAKAFIRVS